MDKRRVLIALDSAVLALFVSLLSWRLTGLTLHEGLGVLVLALLLAHVGVHWGWMESRAVAVVQHTPRHGGELLVNAGLFVTMGATLISGIVISKVIFPNALTATAYLGWHALHESATTLTLVFAGLHLAINWERLLTLLRHRGARELTWRVPIRAVVLRRAASLAIATGMLGALVWGYSRIAPGPREVTMIYRDGRRELRAPPPEITRRSADADKPRPVGGLPRLAFSVLLLAGTMGVGRRIGAARRRARG